MFSILLFIIIIVVVAFVVFYFGSFYIGLFGAIFVGIKGRIEDKNKLAQLPEAERNAIIEKRKQERREYLHNELRKELIITGITVAVVSILLIIAMWVSGVGFSLIALLIADAIAGLGAWIVAHNLDLDNLNL